MVEVLNAGLTQTILAAWDNNEVPIMPEQLPESPPERVGLTRGRPAMTRGRPFVRGQSGNLAGRPPGSRNRTTIAAQALLDGEAAALSLKAVELALGGDIN